MKKWKSINFNKLAPCGFELKYELRLFLWGMVVSILYGNLFFIRLYNTWYELFEQGWEDGKWVTKGVREGAIMRNFPELLDKALFGFLIVAICMMVFIIIHYGFHYQGSKSIYLMKRLPDKWELHRRCITLPLVGIGICLITAFLLLLLYYAVYMIVTPPECIIENQWQKLWTTWMGGI